MNPSPRREYVPAAWEEVDCPFCASPDRRLHARFGWRLRFTHVQCRACGLVYQSPRPRHDADFVEEAYGDHASIARDAAWTEADRDRWRATQEPLVQEILSFDARRSLFLDVGSNLGRFLEVARPRWRAVLGVEVSRRMREISAERSGLRVVGTPFESLALEEPASCIQMSHVLEHVPGPSTWIHKARELLAPDGLLVIAVPNVLSFESRLKHLLKKLGLRRSEWRRASKIPDHLFEPSMPVMLPFVEAHGFRVISAYTYSRRDETSRTPTSRLLRRALPLGTCMRLYARVAPRLDVTSRR